jgi:hypothetical protein
VSYGAYDPPQFPTVEPKPGKDGGAEPRMQYLRVFNYLFEHPNWMMTLLLLAVCMFIPVIGALLCIGYQFVVAEALIRSRGQSFPEFDFNQFTAYLMRGLWPWLVSLIVSFVVVIPFQIVIFIGMFCFMGLASAGEEMAVIGMLLFFVFMFVAILAMTLVMMLIMTPMLMRSGLAQEFGEGFRFAWIKDFIARTWKEMLLFSLVMSLGGMLLVMVGYMVFCVGAYAAIALIFVAQAHMYYQLYELYLARGGEPIPFKAPTA